MATCTSWIRTELHTKSSLMPLTWPTWSAQGLLDLGTTHRHQTPNTKLRLWQLIRKKKHSPTWQNCGYPAHPSIFSLSMAKTEPFTYTDLAALPKNEERTSPRCASCERRASIRFVPIFGPHKPKYLPLKSIEGPPIKNWLYNSPTTSGN